MLPNGFYKSLEGVDEVEMSSSAMVFRGPAARWYIS